MPFGDLLRHRDLLLILVVREIRVRYARALLGMGWAVFVPLVMMLTFVALDFGRLTPAASEWRRVPYSVFACCGILFWTHFATSVTQGTNSLILAADLLRKCAFPREAVPLSKVLAAVLDLLVGGGLLAVLLLVHRMPVGWPLLALPGVFLLQLLFTAGVVLLLSAANVFYRDVNYFVQVGLVLLMFATSVVYPLTPSGPVARAILRANPLSSFIDAYREILLLGRWPGTALWVGAAGAVVAAGVGWTVFRRLSPYLPEEV